MSHCAEEALWACESVRDPHPQPSTSRIDGNVANLDFCVVYSLLICLLVCVSRLDSALYHSRASDPMDTAAELRLNNFKGLTDFDLEATARIWP